EHLEWQLLLVVKNPKEEAIGKIIIGNLDENGYLIGPLDELAASQNIPLAEAERILAVIQGFEPPGVGSRNLRECLLLQLENRTGPLAQKAYQVILDHFEDMEKKRYPPILKALGCTTEELREVLSYISTLEPKPGRSFEADETKYV